MPYYFNFGEVEADGERHNSSHPKAAQFHYLPPPDLGGPPGPVRFSDRFPAPARAPMAPAPAAAEGRDDEEAWRRDQHWWALLVLALREIDTQRAYCRYDGGNDEGFAWLDHVELFSGARLSPDEVVAQLAETQLLERAVSAGLWLSRGLARTGELRAMDLDKRLACTCAAKLLGGYGTGPFLMYGAFTVDLVACTIVDDRNAEPVVKNIDIER